jgi:hypothetical protein
MNRDRLDIAVAAYRAAATPETVAELISAQAEYNRRPVPGMVVAKSRVLILTPTRETVIPLGEATP